MARTTKLSRLQNENNSLRDAGKRLSLEIEDLNKRLEVKDRLLKHTRSKLEGISGHLISARLRIAFMAGYIASEKGQEPVTINGDIDYGPPREEVERLISMSDDEFEKIIDRLSHED